MQMAYHSNRTEKSRTSSLDSQVYKRNPGDFGQSQSTDGRCLIPLIQLSYVFREGFNRLASQDVSLEHACENMSVSADCQASDRPGREITIMIVPRRPVVC